VLLHVLYSMADDIASLNKEKHSTRSSAPLSPFKFFIAPFVLVLNFTEF